MGDSLGDRMKSQYEDRTRYSLPRRSYTVIRIDGKAFHTYTRHCKKPFDEDLINDLCFATIGLCQEAMGVRFAYQQSDEISFLLTDFTSPKSEAWFDGNIQKICSVGASTFTGYFNVRREFPATFDCRVFTIPDYVEVENYFIWRQKDWLRNSVQMLARAHFSHKQLHGKGVSDMHEMLHGKGINWANLSATEKNGSLIHKNDLGHWFYEGAFEFTKERDRLIVLIPKQWAETTTLAERDMEEKTTRAGDMTFRELLAHHTDLISKNRASGIELMIVNYMLTTGKKISEIELVEKREEKETSWFVREITNTTCRE